MKAVSRAIKLAAVYGIATVHGFHGSKPQFYKAILSVWPGIEYW